MVLYMDNVVITNQTNINHNINNIVIVITYYVIWVIPSSVSVWNVWIYNEELTLYIISKRITITLCCSKVLNNKT